MTGDVCDMIITYSEPFGRYKVVKFSLRGDFGGHVGDFFLKDQLEAEL